MEAASLRSLLLVRNITQVALKRAAGIDAASLSRFVSGIRKPNFSSSKKIRDGLKALGVSEREIELAMGPLRHVAQEQAVVIV